MSSELYKNKSISDHPIAFEPLEPMVIRNGPPSPSDPPADPRDVMIPVEYKDNGEIIVRMYAPGAKSVKASSTRIAVWKFEIEMQNRGNGIFECALPSDPVIVGNVIINFNVDGSDVINPYLPVQYYGFKMVNYIEVIDPETPYILLQDVPHGNVTREVFWSDTVQQWIRCFVYTPPAYEKGGEYPVLYIQHGGGENETTWGYNGKLPYIMDNNIAAGKAVPFIVVMNNGMLKKPGDSGMNDFDGIEGIITRDCRAFIEGKYRVKKDKWNRAIAGLSLGSMQASYIGMRNPELFGSIGSFTYLRCRDKDNTYEGNPHLNALKDADRFWKDYKLLFRSIGGAERHLSEFEEDDAFIARYGVDKSPNYVRHIYPGQTHNWNCWRRAFNDFCQVVFQ